MIGALAKNDNLSSRLKIMSEQVLPTVIGSQRVRAVTRVPWIASSQELLAMTGEGSP